MCKTACFRELLSLLVVSLVTDALNYFKDSASYRHDLTLTVFMHLKILGKWKHKGKLTCLKTIENEF